MLCFDPESGQVFEETIVRQPKRPRRGGQEWQHKLPEHEPQQMGTQQGPRSLYGTAIQRLADQAHILETGILTNVPTAIVQSIW